jgi:excisionase family DNA binding protein
MDRILLRPLEAAEAIGVGRSRMYELLAAGEIPSVRIGASIRVPVAALREWIDQQTAARRGDTSEIA